MLRKLTAVAFASAVVLTGCGGDGGDDEPTLTTITEANAVVVSSVVYKAASALFDVAMEGPLSGAVGVVTTDSGGAKRFGLVPFAASQIGALFGQGVGASSAVGAIYEETYQCSGGGTETISLNDADNSQSLSTGDSFKISYAACVEDGVTFNGSIALGDLVVQSETVYTAKTTFDGFRVSEGSEVYGADGDLTLSANETPGQPAVYQISGTSLNTIYNGDEHRLQNFSGGSTVDDGAGRVKFNFQGRVSDSSNNVVVDAKTLNEFVALMTDDHPFEGQMEITGDKSSHALLSALSATQVRILVDENGDGTYEKMLPDLTWDALESVQD